MFGRYILPSNGRCFWMKNLSDTPNFRIRLQFHHILRAIFNLSLDKSMLTLCVFVCVGMSVPLFVVCIDSTIFTVF